MRRCSVILAAALLTASAGAAAQQPASASEATQGAPEAAAQADTASGGEAATVSDSEAADTNAQTADDATEATDATAETTGVSDDAANSDSNTNAAPAPSPETRARTGTLNAQPSATEDAENDKASAPKAADDGKDKGRAVDAWKKITEAELAKPNTSYPYIETHGYFRFRTDSFWRLDLGTKGTSSQLPPIEAMLNADTHPSGSIADFPSSMTTGDGDTINLSKYAKDKAKFLSSANIRFRLEPIFHVTQGASIHVQLNILDNLILGSTPYMGGDEPMAFFSDTQRSPTAAQFGRNSVRINAAYGELHSFLGTLRVGRMPNHWGLGMMFNGGGQYSKIRQPRLSSRRLGMAGNTCINCDYGDYVDRASFTTDVFNHHIMLAYDYSLGGPTQGADDTFGRPHDLGQFDDSQSFVISIAHKPESPEEIALRNRKLTEQNKVVFDYGVYFMYRRQRIEAQYSGGNRADPASYDYIPRDAKMIVPDLWFRLEYQPGAYKRLRIEGELTGVFGSVDYAPNSLTGIANADVSRKIQQVAAALEIDYTNYAWSVGANAGFASGRQTDGKPGLGANYDNDISQDNRFTAFFFDRDYFVDLIMFRQVIGTITNAIYLNPYFEYDLFSKRQDSLGLRLDLIGAMAANAAATPSGKSIYGAEADLTVFYRQPHYGVDVTGGVFLPGNAFNGEVGRPRFQGIESYLGDEYGSTYLDGEAVSAKPAFTLQARFFWAF